MLGELLLSSYLLLVNPSNPDSVAIDNIHISKPIVYTTNLRVNKENNVRCVTKKSELEGITDLKYCAENSTYEDAWAFIPQDSTWYEIGEKETGWVFDIKKGIYTGVSIDSLFFSELRQKHDEITVYHIHPLKNPFSMRFPVRTILIDSKTTSTIPSCTDIMTMHIYGTLKHKIASSMGVTEYGMTSKGKTMSDTTLSNYINKEMNNMVLLYDTTSNTIDETALRNINYTFSQWNNESVWMEFTPYRRILFKEE